MVCSNVETVIKGLKTVTADYALIPGLTVDIPPYAYVEYKCGMLWDGTGPRGVIVSLLNTDPYYAQAGSVVCKAECTESQLVLTVSGEYINNSNTTKTFYVWAKGAGSASNYMWLAYKFAK